MHTHSTYSKDSLISPNELILWGKKKGLDGLLICDHHTLKAYHLIKKKAEEAGFILIPGMEIETHIGEVIGAFISEEIDTEDDNFFVIVKKIREQGGIVIVPHPFDFLRNNHLQMDLLSDEIIQKYIDGIEILNSRIILKNCIKKARNFNQQHQLFETGGSDAHTPKEIGNGYTYIRDLDDLSLETIKNSLLKKKSISMGSQSNPLVHAITVINKLKKGLYF